MLTVAAALACNVMAIPNLVVILELIAGLAPRRLAWRDGPLPSVTVMVPAHDEAAGIARMLARVRPLLPPGARLLVVADNCSDATAVLARLAGAEVTERFDPDVRGKGHALAHGRAALATEPPEIVIVLDADCVPEAGALERLARGAARSGRPVQSCYLFEPRPEAPAAVQISGFAFLVKNLVRQAGLARIAGGALLTGSGMAFPWRLFAEAPLATDNVVEDLAIGIALARSGTPPLFDPAARIWSEPSDRSGTMGQRIRWEHGFVATALELTVPLIAEGFKRGFRRRRRGGLGLVWLGLHIAVPPLVLLLGLDAAGLVLLAALAAAGASLAPLVIGTATVAVLFAALALAWTRHGHAQVGLATLLRIPFYVAWKIPIYLRLARGFDKRWTRTKRE